MKKHTGPDGEPMTSMHLSEAPEISEERLAEIAAIPDEAIDYSDIPDLSDDDEFWANATVGWPPPKKIRVTMRLDQDIVEYFRTHPDTKRGYQTRINWVLRAYVQAKLQAEAEERGRQNAKAT